MDLVAPQPEKVNGRYVLKAKRKGVMGEDVYMALKYMRPKCFVFDAKEFESM